jgi:hypothetical protein
MARRRKPDDAAIDAPEYDPAAVTLLDPREICAPVPVPPRTVAAIAGLHSRADAGLRAAVRRSLPLQRPRGLVVHCTDGNRPVSPQDVPRILRAVQGYHQALPRYVERDGKQVNVGGRGWSDVGYNLAIDEWGHVWTLRGWGVVGAHAKTGGHNLDSHGIVLLGDGREITEAEQAAILWLIADAERRFGPQWVRGHGDIPGVSKACPGSAVMAFVRGLARG